MAAVTTGTKLAAAVAAIFLALYFTAGALGRMDGTPLDVSEAHRQQLARVFPQRWGFFTKSPTTPRLHLYVRDGERWHVVELVGGIGLRTRLGFRREGRAMGRELGAIANEFMAYEWFSCEAELAACLDEPPTTAQIDRLADVFRKACGEMAVVLQPPVPWPWRDSDVVMPSKFAKFEVLCAAN